MADYDTRRSEGRGEEDFRPIGALVLTIGYILLVAAAFALVYFGELLARR
jgi:hypothetical protein